VKGGVSRIVDKRKYVDRRKYLIDRVEKYRRRTKELAVTYRGSRCFICGYNKCIDALEFHHLEGHKKDFGISKSGCTRRITRVFKEADKCLLLCSNCHREVHAGLLQLPRVTLVAKLGEFREAYGKQCYGNPEQSLLKETKCKQECAETRG